MKNRISWSVVSLVLAGCGGGSTGAVTMSKPELPMVVDQENFDTREEEFIDVLSELRRDLSFSGSALGIQSSGLGTPISGSAVFAGEVGVNLRSQSGAVNVIGDLRLSADFSDREIDGSVDNLIAEGLASGPVQNLEGELVVDGRTTLDARMVANLTGDIVFLDDGAKKQQT